MFGRDINAARYRDGIRETPNGPGAADSDTLRKLHDEEGCTVQVGADGQGNEGGRAAKGAGGQ